MEESAPVHIHEWRIFPAAVVAHRLCDPMPVMWERGSGAIITSDQVLDADPFEETSYCDPCFRQLLWDLFWSGVEWMERTRDGPDRRE